MLFVSLIKFLTLAAIISCTYGKGLYEQCAGEGFGVFPCDHGLTCFRRNQYYSSCQYSCPKNQGWECELYTPTVPVQIVADAWTQCGGQGWVGGRACQAGYACYARSAHYSQCRPINDCPGEWACAALFTTPAPVTTGPIVLPAYTQCNNVHNSVCTAGTACFRYSDAYGECRPSCPATWACDREIIGLYGRCGGDGYIGIRRCAPGLHCYARNHWYAECAASCPGVGWAC